MTDDLLPIYEMALSIRVAWQAHSLSNSGSNGTNRVFPRRQLLADGSETDACSGNLAKHHHAALLAEYLEANDCPLCPACQVRDSRRAAALLHHPDYRDLSIERILTSCACCDAHGFLVTAKTARQRPGSQEVEGEEQSKQTEPEEEDRPRLNKHTLLDFSYALALPQRHAASPQLHTRSGATKEEGQMLMKMTARSGEYALGVRYKCVGIGADTEHWRLVVTDKDERRKRHQAVLSALRDAFLSPDGAMTATMLPHLTGLLGVVIIRQTVGRAPIYSALQPDFLTCLQALKTEAQQVYLFESIDTFSSLMNQFIGNSIPALSKRWETAEGSNDG